MSAQKPSYGEKKDARQDTQSILWNYHHGWGKTKTKMINIEWYTAVFWIVIFFLILLIWGPWRERSSDNFGGVMIDMAWMIVLLIWVLLWGGMYYW